MCSKIVSFKEYDNSTISPIGRIKQDYSNYHAISVQTDSLNVESVSILAATLWHYNTTTAAGMNHLR